MFHYRAHKNASNQFFIIEPEMFFMPTKMSNLTSSNLNSHADATASCGTAYFRRSLSLTRSAHISLLVLSVCVCVCVKRNEMVNPKNLFAWVAEK
jgi:hypothetical protein